MTTPTIEPVEIELLKRNASLPDSEAVLARFTEYYQGCLDREADVAKLQEEGADVLAAEEALEDVAGLEELVAAAEELAPLPETEDWEVSEIADANFLEVDALPELEPLTEGEASTEHAAVEGDALFGGDGFAELLGDNDGSDPAESDELEPLAAADDWASDGYAEEPLGGPVAEQLDDADGFVDSELLESEPAEPAEEPLDEAAAAAADPFGYEATPLPDAPSDTDVVAEEASDDTGGGELVDAAGVDDVAADHAEPVDDAFAQADLSGAGEALEQEAALDAEAPVDADMEAPLDADVEAPFDAEIEADAEAPVETEADAEAEAPVATEAEMDADSEVVVDAMPDNDSTSDAAADNDVTAAVEGVEAASEEAAEATTESAEAAAVEAAPVKKSKKSKKKKKKKK